jgi:hypothetical protein
MGYQATTEVKVISPEILLILEADVFCETEGSICTTVIKQLQSWNTAESFVTRRGDVSPTGSKTVAWYQTENMGTREAQYALLTILGVCDVKPINGKTSQKAFWESDQFIVLLKQGNACGGKGLTEVRLVSGAHLPHSEVGSR